MIHLIVVVLSFLTFADYPRPKLLVEAGTLAGNPSGVILDIRPQEQYLAGHIPGAVSVNAAEWTKAFKPSATTAEWGKRLGQVGIDTDKTVIVCGGGDVRDAARVWWILHYWGVRDARILNGGWPAWQASGGPTSREAARPIVTRPKLVQNATALASKDEIVGLLKGGSPQILDVRSKAEYCGETATAKRNGSIPGATNLEWTECIDPKTKKFKSAKELQQLLQEHKVDLSKPAITYCQSGGRASVVAFTLELMGGNEVKNYYQSWAEWGNDPNTPIVKPGAKK